MKTIMDESAINRSLIRMTHEIIEKNKGLDKVVLLGIETRGATLAFRMAKLMYQFENIKVPVASLDISYWRDDVKASDQAFRLPISVQDRVLWLLLMMCSLKVVRFVRRWMVLSITVDLNAYS